MLLKPVAFWNLAEKWKSDASEPSSLYEVYLRFGGLMCTLAGIAALIML